MRNLFATWLSLPFLVASAYAAAKYDTLLAEIRQWQLDNPDVCGQDTPTCGVQRLIDRFETCDAFRITNGCHVSKNQTLGWQVAVRLTGVITSYCGGTLVSSRHVVTAASCFNRFSSAFKKDPDVLKSVAVIIGALDISQPITTPEQQLQVYQVLTTAYHPDYQGRVANSAILKLNRVIKPSSAGEFNSIRPVCLPSRRIPRLLKHCILSGHGIDESSSDFGTLRFTVPQVVSNKACAHFYEKTDEKYTFCAAAIHRGATSDACQEDVGGGLTCKDESSGRWTLQGIARYATCGTVPSLYEDVYDLDLIGPRVPSKPDKCKSSAVVVSDPSAVDAKTFWDEYVAADTKAKEENEKPSPRLQVERIEYPQMLLGIRNWHKQNPDGCGQDTSTCGVQKMVDQFEECNSGYRIVNGCDVIKPETLGWTVSIVAGGRKCSGTLVSSSHVVLAAHCLSRLLNKAAWTDNDFKVTIGAARLTSASTQQQNYKVQAIAIYGRYPEEAKKDSAILRLANEVQLDLKNGIRPACLPCSSTSRALTQCVVAGYGSNPSSVLASSTMMRYSVIQTISDKTCAFYNQDEFDSSLQFCGLGYRHGTITSTCFEDDGAGVICKDEKTNRWTLQGINWNGRRNETFLL